MLQCSRYMPSSWGIFTGGAECAQIYPWPPISTLSQNGPGRPIRKDSIPAVPHASPALPSLQPRCSRLLRSSKPSPNAADTVRYMNWVCMKKATSPCTPAFHRACWSLRIMRRALRKQRVWHWAAGWNSLFPFRPPYSMSAWGDVIPAHAEPRIQCAGSGARRASHI